MEVHIIHFQNAMNTTVRVGVLFVLAIVAIGVIYRVLIAYHGMSVTSWWRSFWHNVEVGGKATSLHQVGLAWDVLPVTPANEARLKSWGLTVVNEGDHLHAQIGI